MAIIAMLNFKGGVGKTTNAIAIAEMLALSGYRTLLIDADHQSTATELLLGQERAYACEHNRRTLHDLLLDMLHPQMGAAPADRYVEHRISNIAGGIENLSMIPGSFRIDEFLTRVRQAGRQISTYGEFNEATRSRRLAFRKWAEENYQVTIIDCPPAYSVQVAFLVLTADTLLAPSAPDRLSVQATLYMTDRLVKRGLQLHWLGTIWTLFNEQNDLHRRMVAEGPGSLGLTGFLPTPFSTIVPYTHAVSHLWEHQFESFEQKYGLLAPLYHNLFQEIVFRLQNPEHLSAAPSAGVP